MRFSQLSEQRTSNKPRILLILTMSLLTILYTRQALSQELQVHPLFVGNEEAIKKSYEYGRQERKRKKSLHYLVGPWRKDLAKVRMPSSKSWTAPNAIIVTPGLLATLSGYFDEMTYEPADSGLHKVAELLNLTKDYFVVIVELYAWPGISDWGEWINRPAKKEDVTDVQFLILVDGKQVIRPIYSSAMNEPQELKGSTPHLTVNQTIIESSNSGSIYGSGSIAHVYSSGSSTVYHFDIVREGYTAYAATYLLVFPLFDDKGKPIVSASTKKLVFKAVRPTYEHTCVFDLSKLK